MNKMQLFITLVINNNFIILDFAMLLVLLDWLYRTSKEIKDWIRDEAVQGYIALLAYVAGATIVRIATGITLWKQESGEEVPLTASQFIVLTLGAIIGTIGVLGLIRVSARKEWGNVPWIATGLIALAISIGLRFI